MKKFMKFCTITILVLVVLGVILWGIGAFTVGSETMSSLVEQLSHGNIHIGLGEVSPKLKENIGDILENNALYDMDDSDMFEDAQEVKVGEVGKTLITEGSINELDIELGGCLFDVKESEDGAYYFAYNGKGKSQVYTEGDELYVKVLNGKEWNINVDNECLTLYIPADKIFDQVEIELGAGQMNLDNLKTKEIDVDLGAGQVLAEGLEAAEVTLSIGAGEILLKDAQLGNIQAEVGAGNCEIEGVVTDNVKADCAMGNVTFELAGNEQEFNYEVQCVTGSISIGNNKYSGLSQEKTISNNASKNMELDCAMGNIEVKFQ